MNENKHSILFILNNKIIQVLFLGKTEIILSIETIIMIYMDKKDN
jgi:hypothetical protein